MRFVTRLMQSVTRSQYLVCMLSCLAASSAWAAENWNGFRGPDGQGRAEATRLPAQWDSETNVAWRKEIPGEGWSSPAIFNGRVYLTTARPADGEKQYDLSLVILDAESGKLIKVVGVFKQDAQAPKIHRKNSHASPTPLIHENRVYIHFGHQGTACLNLDGEVRWSNDTIEYSPVHGNGGTPIIVGDKLIFGCDGASDPFVLALDKDSGEIAWKTSRESTASRKFSFSTAQAIEVNGKTQVITPASNVVCSLDPENGDEIWRVTYDGYSVIPRPVVGDGLIYICTGYNTPSLLAIRPDGKGDVTDTHVEWTLRKAIPHTPSPLLIGDELYIVSDRGIASCLDAKTGDQHWQKRLGGGFSASPVFADGKIYLQSEEGVGHVLKPGKTFSEISKNELNERTLASYGVVDGALFIRSQRHLYRIGR
ncbi:MAG: PQQ-binding-like beta-propeller repeat protein [Pirellulaceae bacterium]|jgi:outer membrane protein assembly factor BamB|nr:PQQ-binding-like beta-propeller repeat protein [Pirellulaceae bacterium]MDP7017078.1 PQQ-binding-like beta-propeller repeat protein [Pirellulaceae bacterium]